MKTDAFTAIKYRIRSILFSFMRTLLHFFVANCFCEFYLKCCNGCQTIAFRYSLPLYSITVRLPDECLICKMGSAPLMHIIMQIPNFQFFGWTFDRRQEDNDFIMYHYEQGIGYVNRIIYKLIDVRVVKFERSLLLSLCHP